AMLYHNDNRSEKAVPLLERALILNRHDHASRFLLSQVYEALKQPARAAEQRRLSEQTRELLDEMSNLSTDAMDKPWDGAIRTRLADLCEHRDKPAEAALWRKAAVLCPPAPPTRPPKNPGSGSTPR